MADPLSVASGVVALSGVALQATKFLFQTIESIGSSKRSARELRDEVEALLQTLEILAQLVTEYEAELSALKLPLFRCGVVCRELGDIISRCVKHPDGQRSSLRDWTRLQYMGEDIASYKNVLNNYKSTINIALGGATFQSVAVTRQVLQDYKDLIQNTTADLQERLDEIEEKLKSSSLPDERNAGINREELQRIEEERQSTTLCLEICKQVSGYLELYQFTRDDGAAQAASSPPDNKTQEHTKNSIARQIAQDSLTSCLQNMNAASARLQQHLSQLEASLQTTSDPPVSDQVTWELQKIKEEKETISHCLTICSDASSLSESTRVNVFEEVTSMDDAKQVLVSTIGDLLNAKKITTGMRSLQLIGQMSDETVQHLSSRHNSPGEKVVGIEQNDRDDFKNRYGTGRPLRNEMPGQRPGNLQEQKF
ncbi:hypothetical protein BDV10DRAFT_179361 [Aspergillus recurvatus]